MTAVSNLRISNTVKSASSVSHTFNWEYVGDSTKKFTILYYERENGTWKFVSSITNRNLFTNTKSFTEEGIYVIKVIPQSPDPSPLYESMDDDGDDRSLMFNVSIENPAELTNVSVPSIRLEVDWDRNGSWIDESYFVQEISTYTRGYAPTGSGSPISGQLLISLRNVDNRYGFYSFDSPISTKLNPGAPVKLYKDNILIWKGYLEDLRQTELPSRIVHMRCIGVLGHYAKSNFQLKIEGENSADVFKSIASGMGIKPHKVIPGLTAGNRFNTTGSAYAGQELDVIKSASSLDGYSAIRQLDAGIKKTDVLGRMRGGIYESRDGQLIYDVSGPADYSAILLEAEKIRFERNSNSIINNLSVKYYGIQPGNAPVYVHNQFGTTGTDKATLIPGRIIKYRSEDMPIKFPLSPEVNIDSGMVYAKYNQPSTPDSLKIEGTDDITSITNVGLFDVNGNRIPYSHYYLGYRSPAQGSPNKYGTIELNIDQSIIPNTLHPATQEYIVYIYYLYLYATPNKVVKVSEIDAVDPDSIEIYGNRTDSNFTQAIYSEEGTQKYLEEVIAYRKLQREDLYIEVNVTTKNRHLLFLEPGDMLYYSSVNSEEDTQITDYEVVQITGRISRGVDHTLGIFLRSLPRPNIAGFDWSDFEAYKPGDALISNTYPTDSSLVSVILMWPAPHNIYQGQLKWEMKVDNTSWAAAYNKVVAENTTSIYIGSNVPSNFTLKFQYRFKVGNRYSQWSDQQDITRATYTASLWWDNLIEQSSATRWPGSGNNVPEFTARYKGMYKGTSKAYFYVSVVESNDSQELNEEWPSDSTSPTLPGYSITRGQYRVITWFIKRPTMTWTEFNNLVGQIAPVTGSGTSADPWIPTLIPGARLEVRNKSGDSVTLTDLIIGIYRTSQNGNSYYAPLTSLANIGWLSTDTAITFAIMGIPDKDENGNGSVTNIPAVFVTPPSNEKRDVYIVSGGVPFTWNAFQSAIPGTATVDFSRPSAAAVDSSWTLREPSSHLYKGNVFYEVDLVSPPSWATGLEGGQADDQFNISLLSGVPTGIQTLTMRYRWKAVDTDGYIYYSKYSANQTITIPAYFNWAPFKAAVPGALTSPIQQRTFQKRYSATFSFTGVAPVPSLTPSGTTISYQTRVVTDTYNSSWLIPKYGSVALPKSWTSTSFSALVSTGVPDSGNFQLQYRWVAAGQVSQWSAVQTFVLPTYIAPTLFQTLVGGYTASFWPDPHIEWAARDNVALKQQNLIHYYVYSGEATPANATPPQTQSSWPTDAGTAEQVTSGQKRIVIRISNIFNIANISNFILILGTILNVSSSSGTYTVTKKSGSSLELRKGSTSVALYIDSLTAIGANSYSIIDQGNSISFSNRYVQVGILCSIRASDLSNLATVLGSGNVSIYVWT